MYILYIYNLEKYIYFKETIFLRNSCNLISILFNTTLVLFVFFSFLL